LCTPSDPTGKIVSEVDLEEICRLAEAQGTVVLSDEVYSAYALTSSTRILEVAETHFIYVDSFSKMCGLTGWRIGYAVSDIETTARMKRLLQLSLTCVPEFVQKDALKTPTLN